MTNELVPLDTQAIARLPTEALKKELANGLTLTAQTLTRLGMVWVELERRGVDLSHLRHGLAMLLPLIAGGALAAEAVVAFAGRPWILRGIQGMALEQQRRLASGELIEVATSHSSSKTEMVPVTALPAGKIRAVFQDGQILSPAEQRVRLGRKKKKPAEAEIGERRYQPHYDRAAGTITVGRMVIDLSDLLLQLSSGGGPEPILDPETEEYVQVRTRLTQSESQSLLAAARRAELPEWELIRKALRAFGLI